MTKAISQQLPLSSDHAPVPSSVFRPLIDAVLLTLWLCLSLAASTSMLGFSRDYYEYLVYYESIPTTFSLIDTRFEPGFHAFSWVARNWFDWSLPTFVFFLTALSLGIKFFLFRRYLQYPLIAALLYIVVFYPLHEYTQYRVSLSLAFGYWAVHSTMDRSYARASILFLIAFSLHYSSFVLLCAAVGGLLVRGRQAVVALILAVVLGAALISPLRYVIQDAFTLLNPLSTSYLDNAALLEGVTLLSVNNLLLIGAVACYVAVGYYGRSRYHALFLTITIASLVPIALLPDAPIIAQRSKEVLFMGVVFLACRNRYELADAPGLAFVVAMAGLLGYLAVTQGVIFT